MSELTELPPWPGEVAVEATAGSHPFPEEPVTTTELAAAGEVVAVLGRFHHIRTRRIPSDDYGALFAFPRSDEGEEDVLVCHFGHLVEVDASLHSLRLCAPGAVLVRAHEEARWVRLALPHGGRLGGVDG